MNAASPRAGIAEHRQARNHFFFGVCAAPPVRTPPARVIVTASFDARRSLKSGVAAVAHMHKFVLICALVLGAYYADEFFDGGTLNRHLAGMLRDISTSYK
jgi:hypothetical protein